MAGYKHNSEADAGLTRLREHNQVRQRAIEELERNNQILRELTHARELEIRAMADRNKVLRELIRENERLNGRIAEWAAEVGQQRRREAVCGTDSGYFRHRRLEEAPCDHCRRAHSEAERTRKARRAA